ncbi:hypothetical protein Tco_0396481 [Tanacetum coccineum]
MSPFCIQIHELLGQVEEVLDDYVTCDVRKCEMQLKKLSNGNSVSFLASLSMVDQLDFVVVTVVGFDNIMVNFVEDVEIIVEVVVVDSIELVTYSTSNIRYQTGDIVRKRLSVEMKVLWDLKKMMSLSFEAS